MWAEAFLQHCMFAQRRLRLAWALALLSESTLCAVWIAKNPKFDQIVRLRRLIRVFAGQTGGSNDYI